MNSYCNKTKYPVRFSDVDHKDELKLSSLLAFLQEGACASADELGFGYDALRVHDYGFIVVATYAELYAPLSLGQLLTVKTWPLPPRHLFFERDYEVENEKGEKLAAVASRWCLIDFNDGKLLTGDKLPVEGEVPYRADKSVEAVWKIQKFGEEGEKVGTFTVKNSWCDHYFHMNNTRYADMFLDCFTMDELSSLKIENFAITYHKQAKEGVTLELFRRDGEGESVLEAREEGELVAQFKLGYTKKEKTL